MLGMQSYLLFSVTRLFKILDNFFSVWPTSNDGILYDAVWSSYPARHLTADTQSFICARFCTSNKNLVISHFLSVM